MVERQPVLVIDKELEHMTYMELREVAKQTTVKQKDVIQLMAQRLQDLNRFDNIQIRDKIVDDLDSVGITKEYINKILGPEYTLQKHNPHVIKNEIREKAKTQNLGMAVRSDTKVTMQFPDELMDLIDASRGAKSVEKFIMDVVKDFFQIVNQK